METKTEAEVWCRDNGYALIDINALKHRKSILTNEIQSTVERICGINPGDTKLKGKGEKLVFARWLIWGYMKRTTTLSLAKLGAEFGDKDHSTVLYALGKLKTEHFFDWRLKYKNHFESEVNKMHETSGLKPVY